jgi:hypothetical protein
MLPASDPAARSIEETFIILQPDFAAGVLIEELP